MNETSSTGLSDREKKKLFASADRHLLELAQISIKSNRLNRLCDLARWTSNEKTVELLVQLAKHHKLVAIVEDLENIKKELFHQNVVIIEDLANTTFTMNPVMNSASNSTATWSTPQLPEIVAKESPSGILANLTPMKTSVSVVEDVNAVASSPAEFAPSPSNPFAKENSNPIVVANEGNAMLDYISAMMKMNNSGKRKATDETANSINKKSSLGSNVFNNNTQ